MYSTVQADSALERSVISLFLCTCSQRSLEWEKALFFEDGVRRIGALHTTDILTDIDTRQTDRHI